jgi:rRNA maturation RNase YbeY
MSTIHFFNQDIAYQLSNESTTKSWIKKVIVNEGFLLTSLNYIFCSDRFLHSINLKYLQHDTLTDIITFDLNESNDNLIEGEIYISIDRVKENAEKYSHNFNNELLRIIIHGALHLMGYNDNTSQQKEEMRKKEEACLSLLNQNE